MPSTFQTNEFLNAPLCNLTEIESYCMFLLSRSFLKYALGFENLRFPHDSL